MSTTGVRLTGDNSEFRTMLGDSERAAAAFGTGVGKKLIGNMENVGRTAAAAIGLNIRSISEWLARMVIGWSKDSEEAWKRVIDLGERTVATWERIYNLRRSDEQELQIAQQRQATALENQKSLVDQIAAREKAYKEAIESRTKSIFQLDAMRRAAVATEKEMEEIARQALIYADQQLIIETLSEKIGDAKAKAAEAEAKAAQNVGEAVENAALFGENGVAVFTGGAVALDEQAESAESVASYEKYTADMASERLAREKQVTEEYQAQVDKMMALSKSIAITRKSDGREDSELSAAELQEKITNLAQAVFQAKMSPSGWGSTMTTSVLRGMLSNAQGNMNERTQFRMNVNSFGEDRALSMVSPFEREKFESYLREADVGKKTLDGITELNQRLENSKLFPKRG